MVNNNFITDIKTKANVFNKFFAEQCTPLKMTVLPIRSLRIQKAHGHDDISIRMIQICDRTLLKPLIIIFQNSVKYLYYPDIWKRSNIPAHKKVINNYLRIIDIFVFYQSLEKVLKK